MTQDNRKTIMELLSPAGSFEALEAAVCAGADAVYLGATAFSARASAANFDEDTLPKAVSYAHMAGVKVLVTVNTMLFPRELEDAVTLALRLRDAGADGLIVQDMGLAQELTHRLPEVPLHASTQATVHNLPGILEMQRRGFERVVLARELSLKQLEFLCEKSPVELEVFTHGALCVSCSGACLMSSMIGGRSGNRGRCAQPCRLPYQLLADQESVASGHMISPRDLMTLPFLGELHRLGVSSLKIEGRLKRPEYVTLTTRAYRRAIDALNELGHYEPTPDCIDELLRIFNRGGFTKGYFYGVDDAALIHSAQNGHTGVEVGKVLDARTGMVSLSEPLRPGDGLQLRPSGEGIAYTGQLLDAGRRRIQLPKGIKNGEVLFKTTDAKLMEEAHCDGRVPCRPMTMFARLIPGELPVLTLEADGMTVTVQGDEPVQAARSRSISYEDAARQFCKMDVYPWQVEKFTLEGEGAFMPLSAQNALRRKALEALAQRWLDSRTPSWAKEKAALLPARKVKTFISQPLPRLIARVTSLPQALAALSAGADGIDLAPEDFTALPKLSDLDFWRKQGREIRLALPLWMPDDNLAFVDERISPLKDQLDGLLVPNPGTARYFMERGWRVCADAPVNAANYTSLSSLLEMGFDRVTLSPELTAAQMREAAGDLSSRCEAIIHGPIALMHLIHCPYRAAMQLPGTGEGCRACQEKSLSLRDRKGMDFPLRHTRLSRCQMTVYNSVIMDTSASLNRLPALGCWRLNFLTEAPEKVADTLQLYKALRDGEPVTLPTEKSPHTTGHWFRGVE